MERRGSGWSRTSVRRAVTLVGLTVGAAFLLVACGGEVHPYTTTSPSTENARDIQGLYKILFWLGLIVFIGVQAALVYTVLRYRRRASDERPQQVHGNRTLEIVWTIIPAAVLLAIFVPTVSTLFAFENAAEEGEVVVDVYGKQWWWEIQYPELGVVTGNEVHVPVNTAIQFRLMSNNVIHSFWVPRLTGKMDVMPGHQNKLGFTTPAEPGEYFGECAEFCGTQHAFMRFKVIVDTQADFDRWVQSWKQGPSMDSATIAQTGDVTKYPAAFANCITCHRIEGTEANLAQQGIGAAQTNGPNLSLFGCRTTIGAGMLHNDLENLKVWIHNAQSVKPKSWMPRYGRDDQNPDYPLTPEQTDQIARYLLSLRPAEGCPTVEAPLVAAE